MGYIIQLWLENDFLIICSGHIHGVANWGLLLDPITLVSLETFRTPVILKRELNPHGIM